jgi:hypothetical protein
VFARALLDVDVVVGADVDRAVESGVVGVE